MLNAIATGFAPTSSVPTGASNFTALAGRAAALTATTARTRLHRQLLELQLPEFLFGGCLGGYKC